MGQQVQRRTFTRNDRDRFRRKVRACLDVLEHMLTDATFDEGPGAEGLIGLEVELNLVDEAGDPAMRNAEVLASIADPSFQTELGRWNIEINVDPCSIAGDALSGLEARLREVLDRADERARAAGARIVMVGILPTLTEDHLNAAAISASPRYALLDEQIFAARGEDLELDITGVERLQTRSDTIAPEAACTSVQLHQQVAPDGFAAWWNASQAVAGVQLAIGANSPMLFGRQLWRETRIALFQQATDTRSEELKAQGVRPRVWFGERWITSIFDLFEENLRYFPSLLPICDDEDPAATFAAGGTPDLGELRLHNGTIYRWNRPVYDVVDGRPHVRVENRVLPAGPTVLDVLANAAFYYGLVEVLANEERPIWSRLTFAAAEENLNRGARDGILAQLRWPGRGDVPAAELVLDRLLPLAAEGLSRRGVDEATAGRLLGVIEGRCVSRRNGATWQVEQYEHELRSGATDRRTALRSMLATYVDLMHSNAPVHTWPNG